MVSVGRQAAEKCIFVLTSQLICPMNEHKVLQHFVRVAGVASPSLRTGYELRNLSSRARVAGGSPMPSTCWTVLWGSCPPHDRFLRTCRGRSGSLGGGILLPVDSSESMLNICCCSLYQTGGPTQAELVPRDDVASLVAGSCVGIGAGGVVERQNLCVKEAFEDPIIFGHDKFSP